MAKLIDLGLERLFQVGIADPGIDEEVACQGRPQIGEPLQFQTLVARGQLLVDIGKHSVIGLGLRQFGFELLPVEIFLPLVRRRACGGKTLIYGGGSGLDLSQGVLDVGLRQRMELRKGKRRVDGRRGGVLQFFPKEIVPLPLSQE